MCRVSRSHIDIGRVINPGLGVMGGVREAVRRELESSLHAASHREMDDICY